MTTVEQSPPDEWRGEPFAMLRVPIFAEASTSPETEQGDEQPDEQPEQNPDQTELEPDKPSTDDTDDDDDAGTENT